MSYGWCFSCCYRVGIKKYRQLVNGICVECHYWKNPSQPIPEEVAPSKPPTVRQIRKRKQSEKANKRLEEEQLLQKVLAELPVSYYWAKPVAQKLGWTVDKARKIAQRLRKKGIAVPSLDPDQMVLEKLSTSKPLSAYDLDGKLPIGRARISEILKDLNRQGLVVAEDQGQGRRRSRIYYRKTSN